MPTRAKLYIGSIITVGFTLLAGCLLLSREPRDLSQYLSYLLLACIGSTLKINLPKIRGTMSVNFVFILIGVALLTVPETMTIGCTAALVQCFWKARKRPAVIQVLFNTSSLATSIALSFYVSHALGAARNLPVQMAVSLCTFYVLNTGMVSLVLSLTEGQTLRSVWEQCYLWAFPYYLVGGAIACGVAVSSRTIGWKSSLLILPMMYMIYSYYRLYLLRAAQPDYAAPIPAEQHR